MRIRHLALAAALILATAAAAESAPKQNEASDHWIGAWGFVPIPLPPGVTSPPPVSVMIPLAAMPAQPVTPPNPPLLDNPGNLPVMNADSDPANVTLRQLVRVAVAGKRIRLRFSNE
ncbi:MAG TPA: hypothetical protein VNY75_07005, partial [Rhizomicrobium sp.]|nr:hypothetical protein [Rhizomicrobium sp.]